mmetsp:Transcript_4988/g.7275  ORF Transcript_4988/g.7275 Transcript_4988/m.7275 type:complete len:109 (+) Transcript_4988:3-329(+)
MNKCDGTHSPLCPSCLTAKETCAHVLMCEEADRVKCFQMSADNLHSWLRSVDTCEVLEVHIMRFVRSMNSERFLIASLETAGNRDPILNRLARSQDKIGWRRFMLWKG